MIITIARECGSGGKAIGQMLSKELGYPLFDKQGLAQKAREANMYQELSGFFEERPVNSLLYAIAMGEGSSPVNERILDMLNELVKEEDCIIIGRCGNFVFRNRKDRISVFLHCDKEKRIEKIAKKYQLSEKEARKQVESVDHARSEFHGQYSKHIWGDAREYTLSIDTGLLGEQATGEYILELVNKAKG